MKEEDDAGLARFEDVLLSIAEDLRQQHEVVVVHPHDAVRVLPDPNATHRRTRTYDRTQSATRFISQNNNSVRPYKTNSGIKLYIRRYITSNHYCCSRSGNISRSSGDCNPN